MSGVLCTNRLKPTQLVQSSSENDTKITKVPFTRARSTIAYSHPCSNPKAGTGVEECVCFDNGAHSLVPALIPCVLPPRFITREEVVHPFVPGRPSNDHPRSLFGVLVVQLSNQGVACESLP